LQNLKKQRYRFKIVINELELSSAAAQPPLDYQAALLAFINCVIISAATLQERIRIRNEFIGESDSHHLITKKKRKKVSIRNSGDKPAKVNGSFPFYCMCHWGCLRFQ